MDLSWDDRLRIREIYYSENEEFKIRCFESGCGREVETEKVSISFAAQMFFDDVLRNIFCLNE